MRKLFLIFLFWPTLLSAFLYEPPPVHREELPSGIKLFLTQDPEFPTVEILFHFVGGSIEDPKGKEGLSALMMEGIRSGGTSTRRPEEIEEELDFIGAVIEASVDPEFRTLSLKILKKDLEKGLEILFDLVRNPAFDPERFEITRERLKESLNREEEEPLSLALREFPKLVYGKKSVWGRRANLKSVSKISWEDLVRFCGQTIGPNRLVIAASGDVTPVEIGRLIKIRTADWLPPGKLPPPLPPLKKNFKEERFLLNRPGLSQSTIVAGHLGEKRTNPDKFALIVMDHILGGSGALTSRLGESIRIEGGQAYSVWSDYTFAAEPGLFYAVAQTESAHTDDVLEKIIGTIRGIASGVRPEELERAKKAILSSFFFHYESRFNLARDTVRFHLWGYPEDYISRYQVEIERLTAEDIKRVAGGYLHPDRMKILVIGSEYRPLPRRFKEWKR